MEIIKLPAGELAPENSDCLHIERRDEGHFYINASALLSCGDGEQGDSVALIGSDPYGSYDEAESAGLAWAADQCVATLYISTSG